MWDVAFEPADVLIFGSETRGIDPALLASRQEQTLRLSQVAGERCLNLARTASAALYESIRQVGNTPIRDVLSGWFMIDTHAPLGYTIVRKKRRWARGEVRLIKMAANATMRVWWRSCLGRNSRVANADRIESLGRE